MSLEEEDYGLIANAKEDIVETRVEVKGKEIQAEKVEKAWILREKEAIESQIEAIPTTSAKEKDQTEEIQAINMDIEITQMEVETILQGNMAIETILMAAEIVLLMERV